MTERIGMIALIVLNYNDADTTVEYIKSVCFYDILNKIIVVDNCSTDDSWRKLLSLVSDKIDVIKTDYNGGYGYGNNFGILYAMRKYSLSQIIISNPDVFIAEETIKACSDFLYKKLDCAAVAPMMLDKNLRINYKCVWRIPTFMQYLFFSSFFLKYFFKKMYYDEVELRPTISKTYCKVDCIAGSFLIVDAPMMLNYGMYDENIFLYCEETVLGLKLREAGLNTYVLLNQSFTHYHSVSIKKSILQRQQEKLMWKSRLYVLKQYYNKNIIMQIFSIAVSKILLLESFVIHALCTKIRYLSRP